MLGIGIFFAAALAISPSDRMAMADRLFNRGEYAAARAEYLALRGAKGLGGADLAYRLAASAESVRDQAALKREADAFLAAYPADSRADRVRLMKALSATGDGRLRELKALDRDDTVAEIRARALYALARETGDISLYERSFKLDPKGSCATSAKYLHAGALVKSADAAIRRKGVGELLDVAFGKDASNAKAALYLAAFVCFQDGRHGECRSLVKRYQKSYPNDERAPLMRRLLALCEYSSGQYAAAVSLCTDEKDETLAFVRAVSLKAQGEDAEARRLLEKYLSDFPQGVNRRTVELQLARMDFEASAKADSARNALAAARRCAKLSNAAEDRLRCGWALEKAGEPEAAEGEYAAIARDLPKSAEAAEALYRRAMSLVRRGKWSAAELSLAEALATGKTDGERQATALYWRGIAAIRCGHETEGADFLREALKGTLALDEAREARLALADIDFNAGRRDAAIAAYAKLVREGAVARMSAAKTLAVGRLLNGEEARLCAKALVANASPEWRQAGYALLGDVEAAAENHAAAAYAYRKCLEESCTTEATSTAAVKLGRYLVAGGDAAEADKVLRKAVELNSGNAEARAEAYLLLAEAAKLRGDAESARGYATVVVTLFERTASATKAKEMLDK